MTYLENIKTEMGCGEASSKCLEEVEKRYNSKIYVGSKTFKDYAKQLRKEKENYSREYIWRLYMCTWADARETLKQSPSMALLERYWVMTATYDGLAISMSAWIGVTIIWASGLWGITKLGWIPASILTVFLVLAMTACWNEARRYHSNQIEELAATMASLKESMILSREQQLGENGETKS
ncbi:MAG: hypothetical protein AAFV93_16515 [Chloroflexota bacterium]